MYISLGKIVEVLLIYGCVSYLIHSTEQLAVSTTHRPANNRPTAATTTSGNVADKNPAKPMAHPSVKRAAESKKLICYYDNQTMRSVAGSRLMAGDIDSSLCTHLIYRHGEFSIWDDGVWWPTESEAKFERASLKALKNLKNKNSDLKILLSIGGYKSGGELFEDVTQTPESRKEFTGNATEFLKKFKLDGLSLGWTFSEYLWYNQDLQQVAKNKFVQLLRELRVAFEPHKYLLASSIGATKQEIDSNYDIRQLSKYLDFLMLDAHHYYRYDTTKTGPHSALYHSKDYDLNEIDLQSNANWSVNYLLSQGAAREKLILGISLDGVAQKLQNKAVNGFNAPTSEIRKSKNKNFTNYDWTDRLSFDQICEKLKASPGSWTIMRSSSYQVPYAANDRQWISYEDIISVMQKARYANSMGLAGVSVFSLDRDDFSGKCHPENFALTRVIKVALNRPIKAVRTATTKTTTTTKAPKIIAKTTTLAPRKSTAAPSTPKEVEEEDDMMMTTDEMSTNKPSEPNEDDMMPDETTTTTRAPLTATTTLTDGPETDTGKKPTLTIPMNPEAPELSPEEAASLVERTSEQDCKKRPTTSSPPTSASADSSTDSDVNKPNDDEMATVATTTAHSHDHEDDDMSEGGATEAGSGDMQDTTTTKSAPAGSTASSAEDTDSQGAGGANRAPQPPPMCSDHLALKFFAGPDCKKYYDCSSGDIELKVCRDNLVWNQDKQYCDEPENVPACKK